MTTVDEKIEALQLAKASQKVRAVWTVRGGQVELVFVVRIELMLVLHM